MFPSLRWCQSYQTYSINYPMMSPKKSREDSNGCYTHQKTNQSSKKCKLIINSEGATFSLAASRWAQAGAARGRLQVYESSIDSAPQRQLEGPSSPIQTIPYSSNTKVLSASTYTNTKATPQLPRVLRQKSLVVNTGAHASLIMVNLTTETRSDLTQQASGSTQDIHRGFSREDRCELNEPSSETLAHVAELTPRCSPRQATFLR